jgi:Glycine-rich domain
MRLELAGSVIHAPPLIVILQNGMNFVPQDYIAKGYTNFDVICIGAGGGLGGGINTANTGTLVRNYGGAGGGGGLHRVRGLLSALPAACPVVVGAGGAVGVEHASDPAATTDGGDGGYSSFNTATCRASGGKGGKRAQSNSLTVTTQANGGQGGVGNSIVAGGGALGGVAGTPSAAGPGVAGTNGADGTWDGSIGQGGGGGAGGVGKFGGVTCNPATAGGQGSYNAGDLSVYGPGDPPSVDGATGALNVAPGRASGAKASPVNSLPNLYGRSGDPQDVADAGSVIIRLVAT